MSWVSRSVHALADDVLAKHRADRGQAVAASCERGPAGALEVQVAQAAVAERHLAQEESTAVTESRRVAAELVAGVRLCDGVGIGGQGVAEQQAYAIVTPEVRRVEIELCCERLVEHQQLGSGSGLRLPADGHLRS